MLPIIDKAGDWSRCTSVRVSKKDWILMMYLMLENHVGYNNLQNVAVLILQFEGRIKMKWNSLKWSNR